MNIELLNTFTNLMTPALLLLALTAAILFYRDYQRLQRRRLEAEIDSGGSISNITNRTEVEKTDRGGYSFVDIQDSYKSIFIDAMNGFSDYAKLKGYNVDISMDSTTPGKVGIRFTILDSGVTVSTNTVRKDVEEYVQNLKNGEDIRNMPMATSPVEHSHLVSALEARFIYMRTQIEMHEVKSEFYRNILADWRESGHKAISYYPASHTQNLQLTVQSEGGSNMRDNYNAQDSQNIAQGKHAKATTKGSVVQIGDNHGERQMRIDALKELEQAVIQSDMIDNSRSDALRHIQNAREELETSSDPKSDDVGKWLDRANKVISTASAGAVLAEKLNKVLGMFGLN